LIALCGQGAGCEGVLEHLLLLGYKLQVFTHPGPLGERMVMQAAKAGMPGTYLSVNDPSAWQYASPPTLLISCGYLEIVTAETLARTPGINCHYALLPRHRGRSAVPWAIIDGDEWTGVSWHWMTPRVDVGNLLMQMTCQIDPGDTQATLFDKLHRLAYETAPAAIRLARGGWAGIEQQGRASRHPAGPPHGGIINPMWDTERVERFIRAMTYPPLPYAVFADREVRSMEEFFTVANTDGDHVYFF
jgi:methionyl-tRNA formyltransferase